MGDSAPEPPRWVSRKARGQSHGASPTVLTPPVGLPVQRDVHTTIPAQRDSSETRTPAQPPAPTAPETQSATTCTCGHERDAHEHLRRGSDCGACGAKLCSAYRARGGRIRRALRRIGLLAG